MNDNQMSLTENQLDWTSCLGRFKFVTPKRTENENNGKLSHKSCLIHGFYIVPYFKKRGIFSLILCLRFNRVAGIRGFFTQDSAELSSFSKCWSILRSSYSLVPRRSPLTHSTRLDAKCRDVTE